MECSFTTCDRPAQKRGWCRTHYQQWVRTGGTFEIGSNPHRGRKICQFPECGNFNFAHGYCSGHARQVREGRELRPLGETRNLPAQELRAKAAARMREYNSRPEVKRRMRWQRAALKYGITKEEYEALWERSGGRCEICGDELQHIIDHPAHEDLRYKSAIDHDHATGVVRGLLCGACNCAIGYMQDDRVRLLKAAAYLEVRSGVGAAPDRG